MLKAEATLSVVVPIYKAEKHIAELCFRIDQYKHIFFEAGIDLLEIILACDEPVDNSIELARQLISKYPYIKIVEIGANSGQHIATAAGILSAQGDWICTLDEDLQHPPEAMLDLLTAALRNSFDIVYARSISDTHAWSMSRDIASRIAKKILTLLTGVDFSQVSSYRMMRGQVARIAASCMDKSQYFDVNLISITSPKRRLVHKIVFRDIRQPGESGYTLKSLFGHFSRLLLSSPLGGTKIFLAGIFPILTIIILFSTIFLLRAISSGIYAVSPGWASIFTLQVISLTMLVCIVSYLVKMLGTIGTRTTGIPPFIIVDRSSDDKVYKILSAVKHV